LEKIGWATFCVIFSQTHLVTLLADQFNDYATTVGRLGFSPQASFDYASHLIYIFKAATRYPGGILSHDP
jgi:hypothetical protein